jgi:broad specificity phosphatase PhoE
MKTLEIRRHSMRDKPGVHLSQAGVDLARRVGAEMGPFARVATSKLPRAYETAIAMGFAVHEQKKLMNTYGEDVEVEVPWPQTFAGYAVAVKKRGAARKYARKLAKYYASLMEELPEGGAALVVNHGGVLELGVIGCLPDLDYSAWGGPLDFCEGVRVKWHDGNFVEAELLRV